jgi:hypothetical protein
MAIRRHGLGRIFGWTYVIKFDFAILKNFILNTNIILLAPGALSDVWNYDPNTNIWTFVAGSNLKGQSVISVGDPGEFNEFNTPGGLSRTCSWIVNGELYMFGGERQDSSR